MKPSWHDAEVRAILDQRKMQRDNEWLRGLIGEPTYLLSLEILGYLPKDAQTELNLLKMSTQANAPRHKERLP